MKSRGLAAAALVLALAAAAPGLWVSPALADDGVEVVTAQRRALRGTWTGSRQSSAPESTGFRFDAVLRIAKVDIEGNVEGEIAWTLRGSPLKDDQPKIGRTATEFVRGTVSPERVVSLEGYRKEDPEDIIALDKYRLILAENDKVLGGITFGNGTWRGILSLTRDASPSTAPDLSFDAQPGKPVADLAEVLPADVLAYVGWAGQDAMAGAYSRTDFKKFWDQPSLAAVRKELADGLASRFDKQMAEAVKQLEEATTQADEDVVPVGEGEESVPNQGQTQARTALFQAQATAAMLELARFAFRRPCAIALVRPPEGPKDQRILEGGLANFLVVMIDLGPNPADRELFASRIYRPIVDGLATGTFDSAELYATFDSSKFEGVTLTRMVLDEKSAACPTWAVCRNVLFFSMNEDALKHALKAAIGKSATLADSGAYRTMREKWGPGTAVTRAYVDFSRAGGFYDRIQAAVQKAAIRAEQEQAAANARDNAGAHAGAGADEQVEPQPQMPVPVAPVANVDPTAAQTLEAFGLGQARYGGSVRYVGELVVANRYIASPTRTGILFPFAGSPAPLTEQEMAIMPSDALAGVVVRGNLAGLCLHAAAKAKMLEPAPATSQPDPDSPGLISQVVDRAFDAVSRLATSAVFSQFGDVGGLVVYENGPVPLDRFWIANPFPGSDQDVSPLLPGKPASARPPFDDEAEYTQTLQLVFKWKVRDLARIKSFGGMPAAAVGDQLLGCLDCGQADLSTARAFQVGDRVIEYVRDGSGGQVAWAYQDDYLIVSNSIRGIIRLLAARPDAAAIRADAAKRCAAHRPKDVLLLAYVDGARLGRPLIETVAGSLKAMRDQDPEMFKALPDGEAAAKLGPSYIFASADPGGVLFTEVGTMSWLAIPIGLQLNGMFNNAIMPNGGFDSGQGLLGLICQLIISPPEPAIEQMNPGATTEPDAAGD